jgi:hypothetical protein
MMGLSGGQGLPVSFTVKIITLEQSHYIIEQGPPGNSGPAGPTGERGPRGENGPQGVEGPSV